MQSTTFVCAPLRMPAPRSLADSPACVRAHPVCHPPQVPATSTPSRPLHRRLLRSCWRRPRSDGRLRNLGICCCTGACSLSAITWVAGQIPLLTSSVTVTKHHRLCWLCRRPTSGAAPALAGRLVLWAGGRAGMRPPCADAAALTMWLAAAAAGPCLAESGAIPPPPLPPKTAERMAQLICADAAAIAAPLPGRGRLPSRLPPRCLGPGQGRPLPGSHAASALQSPSCLLLLVVLHKRAGLYTVGGGAAELPAPRSSAWPRALKAAEALGLAAPRA